MSPQIGQLTLAGAAPLAPAPPVRSTERTAPTGIPATPPPAVSAAVARAAARAADLAAADRELHFGVDARGRVAVQLRDLAGNVLRDLSASEALDVMTGSGRVR